MDWELRAAIDGLYDTFAGYPRPATIAGCPCCWSEDPVPAPGGERPLRELAPDELDRIAAEVPGLAGDDDVLRHYLPRILEIVSTIGFPDDWPDAPMVVVKLGDPEWPEPERAAIRRFLLASWNEALRTEDEDGTAVDEALCVVGSVDPDIDRYLGSWLEFPHPQAALNLERFLILNVGSLAKGKLYNSGWSCSGSLVAENRRRVVAWIKADTTRDAVAAAADRARTPAERDALEECYLRWLG